MSPTTDYELLAAQAQSLLADEHDFIANAANFSALIYHQVPDLNWAGFYLLKAGELVVGPFQGQPACVRIPMGKGVCGTAALRRRTVVVDDVDQFDGHIPCDAASRSEMVVPLLDSQGELVGVFDMDAPTLSRFSEVDRNGLQRLVAVFTQQALS